MSQAVGNFFQSLRSKGRLFLGLLLVVLAGLVALNVVIRPYHPHVALEVYPGFWAVFGLAVAVGMAAFMKGFVTELLAVDEDIYRPKQALQGNDQTGEGAQ